MNPPNPSGAHPETFRTTQWTRVLAARGDSPAAAAALAGLCEAYYQPVFAFIRQSVRNEDQARDFTQAFFLRILERRGVDTASPERGRFRSFLLAAVKHFLADARDKAQAAKRGGRSEHLPLRPPGETSAGHDPPDSRVRSPEEEFDRQWALITLDRALNRLAAEEQAQGRSLWFETLKPWLTGECAPLSQAEAGARLGLSASAVKVAVHRLRRRFRRALSDEVASTLKEPGQVQEELHSLLAALR